MPKTSRDICARALRSIGVLALGEDMVASDFEDAQRVLQGCLDELTGVQGATIAWTIETVPDAAFLPMSNMLAATVAPTYTKQGPNRTRAIGQLRAILFPNDIEDRRDMDDDGLISEAEELAGKRAEFY